MASAIYFLKNFNNYYNRIIKKFDSVAEYISVAEDYAVRGDSNLVLFENKGPVNFNIGDGVQASITYNYDENQEWQPDYVLVCDLDNNIQTRWFCMEVVRTRKKQYQILLRRDLVADNYNALIQSPMFIEKATLQYNDPMIFNSENMTYNQIKKENEILLKDRTQVPWIVGYVASPQPSETDITFSGSYYTEVDDYTDNINNWQSSIRGKTFIVNHSETYLTFIVEGTITSNRFKYTINASGNSIDIDQLPSQTTREYKYREQTTSLRTKQYLKSNVVLYPNIDIAVGNLVPDVTRSTTDTSIASSILKWNNKIIFDTSSNKYYQAKVEYKNLRYWADVTSSSGQAFIDMTAIADASFRQGGGTNPGFGYDVQGYTYNLVLSEVSNTSLSFNAKISASRRMLNDAPYCMFAIPADSIKIKGNSSYYQDDIITNREASFAAARLIAEKLTSSKCYDLQLLPYCPRQDIIISNNKISVDLPEIKENLDYNYITYSGQASRDPLSIILWGNKSEFNLNIGLTLNAPNNATDLKIENETSFYRLCSPNYSGAYEFNIAKSYGINYINIDCSYKPYTPYIHANPEFKGLYGNETGDTRGLICSGDFSLPQTSDKWAEYELNNKNYQNSFNRTIENMTIKHRYQMAESGINAITGALGAGANVGMATGNVVAGAVAGGLSLAAGAADQVIQQRLFNENIDYEQDQFGYQLGNIQARPDTLGRVSAFNPNNKVFLFLEHYDCTDEEKAALRNKLYYNGMSVGRIDIISNVLQSEPSYIKGKLIRLKNIVYDDNGNETVYFNNGEDFHGVNELGIEMSKGVFI